MIWDSVFAVGIVPQLLRGLSVTILITLTGSFIALIIGLIVAIPRFLKVPVLSQALTFYVQFIRGTPLLIQAYAIYFILPSFGVILPTLLTGIIVMGINYSAYTAEVYRAGIESVPQGQWEAARALSLPKARTWWRIIIPLSLRGIVPALGNYVIQMFKDSAILSAITVTELMTQALKIGSSSYRYVEPLTLAGVLFLIVSYAASLLVKRVENNVRK
ncbi:MAG: ectoine/hydroxyectoine ABC transporter permease subunit EhuD [Bifidobacterium subtile]|jgi:polar amino acid transport system permease protein|nr:ectoine/hydroxyectoine ABC transporter permease subunit EhuD [Bifidobacterium subtile]MCI1257802.1 ectoine/hydroxyectoine ABC transporter permease subunit EhuD [Bifidobacterium subtile]